MPKKKKMSKKKRKERQFKTDINTVFKNCGFHQVPTRDTHFEFKGRKGELDNIFVFENIVVLSEDTTISRLTDLKDHIRKKSDFFQVIKNNKNEFMLFLAATFNRFEEAIGKKYDPVNLKLIFIYFSMTPLEKEFQSRYAHIKFVDYPLLKYFLHLSKAISKSTRF